MLIIHYLIHNSRPTLSDYKQKKHSWLSDPAGEYIAHLQKLHFVAKEKQNAIYSEIPMCVFPYCIIYPPRVNMQI